ncbi:MAG: FtsK/SpoIIIE domain-containing protein [Butyricicoccus sp.]
MLPQIVIVIDELADLMMVAARKSRSMPYRAEARAAEHAPCCSNTASVG